MPLGLNPAEFLHIAGAVSGFSGVALGAFGAHGLQKKLAHLPDAAYRVSNWKTAASYQLVHTLAVLYVSQRLGARPHRSALSGYLFLIGNVLFSGSIYLLSLDTQRKYSRMLGPVTPIGGMCYLAGWVALIWA
ncbi:uncharacterized protein SPPG_04044 [Spizellomyces punctatus DAOM BR117]|uniref:DUF423-domain-containing protein n=1 Tax=Spizellomyces punctatus (strain DAOM BR117) TaxID=645134 RepID=A0A0L0HIT1_SPIPD|nr:uncharacterized protein SPPG_04044 [Spizellomyces punctatus DAOM BR117]KND00943.1 hypothetical protein SPPG_04044 [Spizellomyces punctatus DAOM BR117]|eukprot:XP_016608982.1 hypothetical protein SPPG_04044 [Spizellomyces punctatus DAOM BR117]